MIHFFTQTLAADNIGDGGMMIRVGVLFLAVALFALWRTRRRSKSNTIAEAARDRTEAVQSQHQFLQKLEVRLYDYSREVEGRIESRLAILDQLMVEAQRETDRLEELLERTQANKDQFASSSDISPDIISLTRIAPSHQSLDDSSQAGSPMLPFHLSVEQRQMIVYLHQAGFRADEIARCMERTVSEIDRVLELYGEGPSSQAA
ncbi:MAG: hypothetical protein O2955_21905 [Planctomycetota bacterium]|nr:hypothetical protein [Planctomycetota bacterium]MDA1215162.1 hypothetical protein [Planctomycetota bacterium]